MEIKTYSDLQAHLLLLKTRQKQQEERIKIKSEELSEKLRPSNLAKEAINDFFGLKDDSSSGFAKVASLAARFFLTRAIHKESPLEYWLKEVGVNTGGVLTEKLTALVSRFLSSRKKD